MTGFTLTIAGVTSHLEPLLGGVPTTVEMTCAAFTVGAVLAVPLTFGARSRLMVSRFACRLVIDFIRSVPPLVWLFVLFYGFAEGVVKLSPSVAGILGLGIVSAGYLAEIYKGGLTAVHRMQWEAGQALGLRRIALMRWVIAPQAFRMIVPGAGVWALTLLKESAVVSIVGASDVAMRALQEQQATNEGLDTFVSAAVVYIALSIPIAVVTRLTYRRMIRLRAAI